MELGGFEPPTSWVRSKEVGERDVARNLPGCSTFLMANERLPDREICRDMNRYAGSQALLAKSA
jgi:hypothetical protein